MKKHIIGALVVLLLPAVCLAAGEAVVKTGKQSDANITGHVVDAKSGEHLAYATVAVKGTTIGCATDATGHYFEKPAFGTFYARRVVGGLPVGRNDGGDRRRQDCRGEFFPERGGARSGGGRRFGQSYGDQPEVLAHDRLRRLDETVRIDRVEQPG